MAEGVVFDLGWRPHDGPRLGRAGARRAIYRDGLRRVLGLRRRARRKVFPVAMLSIAILPSLFFVALSVIAGEFDASATFFGHSEYFDLTGALVLIFTALAASELLIPDRVNGTLSVYASRPLTTADYVSMRAASLATVVFGFLWLPHVVLFLGRAWVEGFGSYVTENFEVLGQTALASAVYFLAFAPLGFLVAAFSKRSSLAAGVFLGVVTISSAATRGLIEAGIDFMGLFAFQHHPGYVKDWIMGSDTHQWIPEDAGFDPAVSLLVVVVVAALSSIAVLARQKRAG
jgi:ABC-2 type transport system permease protein